MSEGTRTRTIRVNGLELSVVCLGPADGQPVLCLHGWLDNAHSFLPLSRAMPELQLLALELPGHGHSHHRPAGVPYQQLDWVLDVVAAADALGLSRFVLMGHSMGAGIAALAAGTCPERVSRLVLLEGIGPRAHPPETTAERLAAYVEAERKAAALRQLHRGAPFSVAVRARLAFADPLLPSSAELLCQRGVEDAPGGVRFRHDRRLQRKQPTVLSEEHIRGFLRRITCPTLLLLAEQGIAYDPAVIAGRAAAVPKLEQRRLPGGHHVHMDHPEAVANHLRAFLQAT